jgi:Zn-dependent metalloprotease
VGGVQLYTAKNQEIEPGTLLTDLQDPRAKEADTGVRATTALLRQIGNSFGDQGLIATVHYGLNYDNAFWDGTQMVFGDGDGRYFGPFTEPIDVCGHELGHGVTGDLLDYQGQAGALNESMSDCIGATVRQKALSLSQSDPTAWLIGYGLFTPNVQGRALRDMLNPGTAYDDPYIGKDPQPADMSGYVATSDDDGGVHLNSGIPNRAFALAALGIGDSVKALEVWQKALAALRNPSADFMAFAHQCVAAAGEYSDIVLGAWTTVGVLTATPDQPPSGGTADVSFLDQTVQDHIQYSVGRSKDFPTLKEWMDNHFQKYFRIK